MKTGVKTKVCFHVKPREKILLALSKPTEDAN